MDDFTEKCVWQCNHLLKSFIKKPNLLKIIYKVVVERKERPRKSSLASPDKQRRKKQSNVSFSLQV